MNSLLRKETFRRAYVVFELPIACPQLFSFAGESLHAGAQLDQINRPKAHGISDLKSKIRKIIHKDNDPSSYNKVPLT